MATRVKQKLIEQRSFCSHNTLRSLAHIFNSMCNFIALDKWIKHLCPPSPIKSSLLFPFQCQKMLSLKASDLLNASFREAISIVGCIINCHLRNTHQLIISCAGHFIERWLGEFWLWLRKRGQIKQKWMTSVLEKCSNHPNPAKLVKLHRFGAFSSIPPSHDRFFQKSVTLFHLHYMLQCSVHGTNIFMKSTSELRMPMHSKLISKNCETWKISCSRSLLQPRPP